jgi:hypothetical protein
VDDFKFVRTKSGRSFLRIVGPEKDLMLEVASVGRMWGQDGVVMIAMSDGSCETAQLEGGKLIEGFLAFLDEA